eukprot:5914948-Prymnesium_polylepis.1
MMNVVSIDWSTCTCSISGNRAHLVLGLGRWGVGRISRSTARGGRVSESDRVSGLKLRKCINAAEVLSHQKWGLSCESDPLSPG